MLTLLTFVKVVQSGSLLWSLAASVSYLYTAASWGGHIIIPNLLALYMLCLLLTGSGPAPPHTPHLFPYAPPVSLAARPKVRRAGGERSRIVPRCAIMSA